MIYNNISLSLDGKRLKIIDLKNIDKNLVKKLSNLGIYKSQIIVIRKIGNTKHMIGIEVNKVIHVFRLNEVKEMITEEEDNNEK